MTGLEQPQLGAVNTHGRRTSAATDIEVNAEHGGRPYPGTLLTHPTSLELCTVVVNTHTDPTTDTDGRR